MVSTYYKMLFEALSPSDKLAYRYYDEEHTYADMHGVMCQVNAVLDGLRNRAVVIYSDKSFESYGAIFATILSGNTWVPLSSALPIERNIAILDMITPGAVFVDCELPSEVEIYLKQNNIVPVDLRKLDALGERRELKLPEIDPDDVAYIMFTSGSTGAPKGVPMTHVNYVNFVQNCINILDFQDGDVFSDYHDFAFDISVFYVFCFPMASGVIAPVKTSQDRVLPLLFMQQNKVTVWSSVPSVINRVKQMHDKANTDIRVMFLCGEPFALSVLEYCFNGMEIPHVYNFYGLTETGVENFHHQCEEGDVERFKPYGYVPIGQPLPGNDVDVSEDGELFLSGCQVTPGYLGGIGQERFFEVDGKTWYRTGDIVGIHDGHYFCKGRMDTQIKLRGYRIELMDVEVNLSRHPMVRDAICFPIEHMGRNVLVAVVLAEEGQTINPMQLRKDVSISLPSYMMPDRFFEADTFPVNSNGKKDRKAVREAYTKKMSTS